MESSSSELNNSTKLGFLLLKRKQFLFGQMFHFEVLKNNKGNKQHFLILNPHSNLFIHDFLPKLNTINLLVRETRPGRNEEMKIIQFSSCSLFRNVVITVSRGIPKFLKKIQKNFYSIWFLTRSFHHKKNHHDPLLSNSKSSKLPLCPKTFLKLKSAATACMRRVPILISTQQPTCQHPQDFQIWNEFPTLLYGWPNVLD